MGNTSIGEYIPFIIMGVFAGGDILLLKLALVITKAQKRTRMKWVAGSFAIQFGIVFIISSPLFLLGFVGAFNGGGPKLDVLIPIVILSAFINLSVINVLHQVGLKSSSVILLLVFVPIFLIMFGLSQIL